MEGKTPTEKIHYLSNLVASLSEKVSALEGAIKSQVSDHSRTTQALGELKNMVVRIEAQVVELQRWKGEIGPPLMDFRTDLAVLKQNVDELKKVKEEWSRRVWAMAGPILGAVVGWALGYFSRR